jgi:hypothetical protein
MRTVVVVGCDGVEEIREGRDSGYDVSGAARGVKKQGRQQAQIRVLFTNTEALDRQGSMRACTTLDSKSQLAASLSVTPFAMRVSSR